MEKFKLHFLNDGIGLVEIDEPFGNNEISYDFKRKNDGHAMDVTFNGGDIDLEFTTERNHYLEELIYYFNTYKTESNVKFIVSINGVDNIIGDLDFVNAKTDELEYFRCKVVEKNENQILKRRKDAEVDLFSSVDLDKNPIEPIKTYTGLLKAKSVFLKSEWEQTEDYYGKTTASDKTLSTKFFELNTAQNLKRSDIEESYTVFEQKIEYEGNPYERQIKLITAKDNLKNIKITIPNDLIVNLSTDVDNGGNGYADFSLEVWHGVDGRTATKEKLYSIYLTENKSHTISQGFNYTIEQLERGESIWVFFFAKVRQSASSVITTPIFELFYNVKNFKINIEAEQTGYNSLFKMVRLIDAQKQVVKSVSGLETFAPVYDYGGALYDNFLTNGALLRNKTDVPFNLSMDDISKGIKEFYSDFETNDKVFFGLEKDFYTNKECWFFDDVQFSGFSKGFNAENAINIFEFKYKNYQALKENEQPSTSDTIHGESKLLLDNKMTENKKVVEVGWIRCVFLIDEARKKSLEISKDTSYKNDSDIFILDCIENNQDLEFIERTEFLHQYDKDKKILVLKSNQTLNFLNIGIVVGSTFKILDTNNQGIYTVVSVVENQIDLQQVSGAVLSTNNNGKKLTKYIYTLLKENIQYITRTNEGIDTVDIKSPESFNNMAYSVANNIRNFYSDYLATCNLSNIDKSISVNDYKHNGKATTVINGVSVRENEDINPKNPIHSPYLYTDVIFANVSMEDFLQIKANLQKDRGYIRSVDKNGNPIKIYPKMMSYTNLTKELIIKEAKEKYEPILMTIETSGIFILINKETMVNKKVWGSKQNWSIENQYFSIFDNNGYRFYKKTLWNKVSVNGVIAKTQKELESWLNLIG